MQEVTAGDPILTLNQTQLTADVGVLDPREQQSESRGGIPENYGSNPTLWWDNPKVDILQLVRAWLCDESNG